MWIVEPEKDAVGGVPRDLGDFMLKHTEAVTGIHIATNIRSAWFQLGRGVVKLRVMKVGEAAFVLTRHDLDGRDGDGVIGLMSGT